MSVTLEAFVALRALAGAARPFDKGCHIPECKLRQALERADALLAADAPGPVESMKGGRA